MKSFSSAFFLIFLGFAAQSTAAQDMAFPLVCEPGRTCFILNYPDLNAAAGKAQDYACGPSASDGDLFLRLALPDATMIGMNVLVLAAADGVVEDASDGISDRMVASKAEVPAGTLNCGNGIVIDHGMGWQTAYCHLKKGSIAVREGERVVKGQAIAAAGQSGLATWPQLGFAIRKGGYLVDPITGQTQEEGCGFKERPVIALPPEFMRYQPASIVTMGFSLNVVNRNDIAYGSAARYATISRDERRINLWAMAMGVHKDDKIEVRIRDPRGRTFHHQEIIADGDYERLPINAGRERGYIGWRQGEYVGSVSITRVVKNKPVTVTRQVSVIVE